MVREEKRLHFCNFLIVSVANYLVVMMLVKKLIRDIENRFYPQELSVIDI